MSRSGWTLRTVTEAFLAMEEELDLLRGPLRLTWEASRFALQQRLLVALGAVGQGQVQFEDVQGSRVSRALAYARNALTRPSLATPRTDMLILGHPRRRRAPGNKWTDPYVDPLLDELGGAARVMEPPHLGRHRKPTLVPGVRHLDDVILLGGLRGVVAPTRASAEEASEMGRVEEALGERFGVAVGARRYLEEVRRHRETTRPLYGALLDRTRPRLLCMVCAYGWEPLVEAAKTRGVPVVELQHGIIYPYHLGYTYPATPKSTFPDHLLTFGAFWNDATAYPIPEDRVHAVGYPAFDLARAAVERRPGDSVLFVSQLAVGEPLSRMAVAYARRTGRAVDYKLHPGEVTGWEERYPWLRDSGVRVLDDAGMSIYELFGTARAQVGVFSTALYEGIGLGVPTVVADLPGSEASEPLVRLGYAAKAADASELEAALDRPRDPVDAEALFRPGAVPRIVALLREIAGM